MKFLKIAVLLISFLAQSALAVPSLGSSSTALSLDELYVLQDYKTDFAQEILKEIQRVGVVFDEAHLRELSGRFRTRVINTAIDHRKALGMETPEYTKRLIMNEVDSAIAPLKAAYRADAAKFLNKKAGQRKAVAIWRKNATHYAELGAKAFSKLQMDPNASAQFKSIASFVTNLTSNSENAKKLFKGLRTWTGPLFSMAIGIILLATSLPDVAHAAVNTNSFRRGTGVIIKEVVQNITPIPLPDDDSQLAASIFSQPQRMAADLTDDTKASGPRTSRSDWLTGSDTQH